MINVVACACAEPSNPPFKMRSVSIYLTDVTKHVFITEESTFIIVLRLESNKVLYLYNLYVFIIFLVACTYFFLFHT